MCAPTAWHKLLFLIQELLAPRHIKYSVGREALILDLKAGPESEDGLQKDKEEVWLEHEFHWQVFA